LKNVKKLTRLENPVDVESVKIPRILKILKLQNRREKPAVRLEAAEIVVETSRANLLQMVLPVNHAEIELANHVMARKNLDTKEVMTILRANHAMMMMMLLVKPKRLRPQFSFDAILADVAVVDGVDVTEMLMLLASLSLMTRLEHRAATEPVSHVTMTPLVSHVTMTKPMQVKPPQCLSNFDGILAEDVAKAEVTMSLASHLMVLLVNHEATELVNHGTRPRSLVKAKNALVAEDVMTIQHVNLAMMTKLM